MNSLSSKFSYIKEYFDSKDSDDILSNKYISNCTNWVFC